MQQQSTSNNNNGQSNSNNHNNNRQQMPRQYGGYLGKQQQQSPSVASIRYAMLENKNIARPQTLFKDKIDNSYKPFEPLIKQKPNAHTPLRLNIRYDDHGNEYYTHPYEYEIRNFPIKPHLLQPYEPIEPAELEATKVDKLIDTIEELDHVCEIIAQEKAIAVDIEHHSYRSFQGITCLIQISTRQQDFVIDAINLRSELYRLNECFTNPDIVKVFHGADCDVLWLQRDFGVYVVNLFDTSRAAKLMKFAHLSLAFLMKHYCDVEADKLYQLADWRERPLPEAMLEYAREDTHYLLYIHDKLRNDLLAAGGHNRSVGVELLKNVFEKGKEICLKRYEKPLYSDTSHLSVLKKSRLPFNSRQMYVIKELYAWRDQTSRELDESVGYVLPNNLMIRIAQYLPREPQCITALCHPVPPMVKKYLSDIHAIILKALDLPLEEAPKTTLNNPLNIDPSFRSIDLDASTHKQDIAHASGLQEGTGRGLLDEMYPTNCTDINDRTISDATWVNRDHTNHRSKHRRSNKTPRNINQAPSRVYTFLDSPPNRNGYAHQQNARSVRNNIHESIQFESPYQRYISRNKND